MGVTFSFLFDILVFKQTFTDFEVLGVLVCLFFSFITAVYKHFYCPLPEQSQQQPELKKDMP